MYSETLNADCLYSQSLTSVFLIAFSPTGKKFRSKPQLARYLGNTVDLACFDFRTGKMMPGKLQKNKQRLRHETLSLAKVGMLDYTRGGRGAAALSDDQIKVLSRPQVNSPAGQRVKGESLCRCSSSLLLNASTPQRC